MSPGAASAFELRFRSLSGDGRGFAFPCDAQGHVAVAELSERGRASYRLASSLVGRDLALPTVEPVKGVAAIGSLMPVIAR